MIHINFSALYYSTPISVPCPTREEAELLFSFMRNETDVLWANRTSLSSTNWNMYKSQTHYDFGSHNRGLQYGNGSWGKEHGSQFMTVHEFIAMYRLEEDDEMCVDLSHVL